MLEQPCFLSFPESTEQGGGWGSEAGPVLFLAKLDLGVGAQGLGISPARQSGTKCQRGHSFRYPKLSEDRTWISGSFGKFGRRWLLGKVLIAAWGEATDLTLWSSQRSFASPHFPHPSLYRSPSAESKLLLHTPALPPEPALNAPPLCQARRALRSASPHQFCCFPEASSTSRPEGAD